MISYAERLRRDGQLALSEANKYFSGKDDVHATLTAILARLDQLNIPYALVGGLALFQHGYRRFTEDVDLLVKKDDLRKIHEALEGRGYLPKFKGSKNLKDTNSGVAIEFGIPLGLTLASLVLISRRSAIRTRSRSSTVSTRRLRTRS